MKRRITKLFVIIFCIIISCIIFSFKEVKASDEDGNFVIVLDPGHGGGDPGACAGGLAEAQVNFKIAYYAKQELEQYEGVKVYLTRYNNCPSLSERAEIAKNYGADLLVSMHINSGNANNRGAAIWVTCDNSKVEYHEKAAEVGSRILSRINSLGIRNNGIQIRYSNENRWYESGIKQDYYGIIRNAQLIKLRSILIEHCFISSSSDRTYIDSDSKIQALAHQDVLGIAESYDLHKKGQGYVPVKSISLNNSELILESTSSDPEPIYNLNAIYNPSGSSYKSSQWYSSDSSIVRVYNGRIRGLKPGTATITAISLSNQRIAKCKVTVVKPKVALESISVDKNEQTVGINETGDILVTFNPSNADNKELEWTSSNPDVVRIWFGHFRGLKEGKSVITATSKVSGKSVQCTVNVLDKEKVLVEDIKLEKDEYEVIEDEAVDLPYTYLPTNSANATFEWSSSNPEILRVWGNRFRGLKEGTAYVIVRTKDGNFEKKIKVTVKKIVVEDVQLEQDEFQVVENEAVDLPFTYSPENATDATFEWSSSNPEILRVWGNRFRGLKEGTAYVIVRTTDGKFEKKIKVTITKDANYTSVD